MLRGEGWPRGSCESCEPLHPRPGEICDGHEPWDVDACCMMTVSIGRGVCICEDGPALGGCLHQT